MYIYCTSQIYTYLNFQNFQVNIIGDMSTHHRTFWLDFQLRSIWPSFIFHWFFNIYFKWMYIYCTSQIYTYLNLQNFQVNIIGDMTTHHRTFWLDFQLSSNSHPFIFHWFFNIYFKWMYIYCTSQIYTYLNLQNFQVNIIGDKSTHHRTFWLDFHLRSIWLTFIFHRFFNIYFKWMYIYCTSQIYTYLNLQNFQVNIIGDLTTHHRTFWLDLTIVNLTFIHFPLIFQYLY